MQEEPKQVIVVRKDLNMRKGKIAAQAAHASMAVLLNIMDKDDDPLFPLVWFRLGMEKDKALHQWLTKRFTKICVSVDSEQELMDIFNQANEAKLLCAMITDAGLTEFNGVPTRTCLAIGPAYPERIDPITQHLKLL
ncbi:aminoacyl-tRNA hydrolase [Candidatus Thorarchaeota archaeon]|nr:MAG: aminoacyl-tRNA hydrolase [Candidatus Thorarchaeota archaeon]